ncbi:MAG TPA: ATP-binding protein [Acidobacteriaceae bacterium]|nr:ATP-binding protein [Acidobacteriaceae bacterium]
MRLKTKLVLAITGLVFLVVCTLSWVFVGQLLRQRIAQAYADNDMVAREILFATQRAIQTNIRGPQVDPNDPHALYKAVAAALRSDPTLKALMDSAIRYSPTVFDVSIADSEGRGLLSTDPTNLDHLLPHRQEYQELQNGGLLKLLEVVFGPPRVYNVTLPLDRAFEPFATIRVGVRTTFLRFVVEPWLIAALTYTGVAIICSLIFAAFLANVALKPIEQIGARLDALALAEAETASEPSQLASRSGDAVVLVSNKIERIGRRMRNVEEVFSALKENLDQIMTNLQDGILLYTHDARAVLVSDSVERFLGISRAEILGAKLHEVFSRNTRLGRLVRESFDARMVLVQEEITTETGRHVEISLDFIHDDRAAYRQETLGALLTLHDVESVREIESDLQLSRRLAAIGRLTAGVGHEVKNPINAIVVHLELMRNKLGDADHKAMRHLEVIESEIQRLDRVVQTLVDFSRPVELQLKEQDLRRVVSGVLMLASAELETRNVYVQSDLPDHPVSAKVDADLLKQALLNVVLNGAQAMAEGGKLEVRLAEDGRMALLSIQDQGSGIPPEVRDKIFDLYFTTKKDGSGIGLAMTYRIVELHNGSIEVESDATHGTTFILRFPLANLQEGRARGYFMPDGSSPSGSIVTKEPRG